ncbi:PAS domain S-box protein, partial [Eubacterium pyruvativorans]
MTKKIFRAVLLGTIAVLVFTTVMLSGIMYRYMTQVSERQLRTQLNLASRGLTLEGTKYFRSLNDENVRITWIDRNGKVLYDSSRSDVSGMENHRDRKEVQEALQKGYGESERYSTTLTEKMLYAARRQPDGTVLRMSVSQYSVWMLLVGMIQPFVIIIIVAVLLSLLLASRLSKRVVKPLNDVDLDHPLENEGCDEIAPILRKIDYQQRQLARQEQSLDRQQDELNTILQNMAEGMILLRRGGKIISINNPAAEILGITGDHTGESLLQICRNLELEELVRKGLDGTPAEQVLALESGRYQVQVMPVREDKEIRGVTVVLFDVTDRELAEQMRREFTANVSHEL